MAETILIFDEPELHINKSILAKMWDEIESARPDCCFLYITHDVEFAGSRRSADKYALRNDRKTPNEAWDIESIPNNDEIPDDIIATIIGSRRPVLFVEGDGGSLDSSIYRRVYDNFTVIPVGSCDQVIHTVATFAARPELHRVGCAGLVDADGRTDQDASYLESRGVYRLPVSEVENLLLLQNVFIQIALSLKFNALESEQKFESLKLFVIEEARKNIDQICLRYTKRKIDSNMKKIGLSGISIEELAKNFESAVNSIDVVAIFDVAKTELADYISQQNYDGVLLRFDNKGLLTEAAKKLGMQRGALEEFVGRELRSDGVSNIRRALLEYLPTVVSRP